MRTPAPTIPVPKGAKNVPWPKSKPFPDVSWARESWTADESPYLAVRKEVEEYVRGRGVSDVCTDLYERTRLAIVTARVNPNDPVKRFCGAYYAYMLLGLEIRPEAKRLVMPNDEYTVDLIRPPSPHSREYDRLRLLMYGGYDQAYLDLGERLYAHDPDDTAVAVKLAWTHDSYKPGSRRRALQIAERLLAKGDPKAFPAIYYAYGLAHHQMIREEPDAKHLERAQWAYDRYLAAGPKWRPLVDHVKRLKVALDRIATQPTNSSGD